jgi:hypothetical protein
MGTRPTTRSPRRRAASTITAPPIEWPTSTMRSSLSRSATAFTSSPNASIV